LKILEWPHEILKTKCNPITEIDERLYNMLDAMWATMEAVTEIDAMGLAANQIGVTKRVFIMKTSEGEKIEFINPEWKPLEASGWADEVEGCLSTPGLFETAYGRYNSIKVVSLDRDGCKVTREAHGIDAVCVQHEVDHLNGIFWFQRMKRNPRRSLERQWKKKGGSNVLQSV